MYVCYTSYYQLGDPESSLVILEILTVYLSKMLIHIFFNGF